MALTTRRAAPDSDESGEARATTQADSNASLPPEQPESDSPRRARRLASGTVIREAAAALFLEKGYQGTSMDDIAAAARISKQTIYTHFADKESLFTDLVLGNADRVDAFVQSMRQAVHDSADVRTALTLLARQYVYTVSRPEVLRLRRLVIGESGRFPDVARAYYEQVPQRMYSALADLLRELTEQGELRLDDPTLAAYQFAWLVLGIPLDRGMFLPTDATLTDAEFDRIADAGVTTFLAAYGVHLAQGY